MRIFAPISYGFQSTKTNKLRDNRKSKPLK